jgi:hypothetical protein
MRINEKGQCPVCLIKPLIYKKSQSYFCYRCDRAFSMLDGEWISNFGWDTPTIKSHNSKMADLAMKRVEKL